MTLSVENKIIVLEKSLEKSWILDPKICMNTEHSPTIILIYQLWGISLVAYLVRWALFTGMFEGAILKLLFIYVQEYLYLKSLQ